MPNTLKDPPWQVANYGKTEVNKKTALNPSGSLPGKPCITPPSTYPRQPTIYISKIFQMAFRSSQSHSHRRPTIPLFALRKTLQKRQKFKTSSGNVAHNQTRSFEHRCQICLRRLREEFQRRTQTENAHRNRSRKEETAFVQCLWSRRYCCHL